ncbi:MAG: hypothetical protein HN617_15230 [Planctomycetaceae bacterium]|jgi:hypothetical protein|nr:hypothetical protein [Planctomycetaceae bacterium]MBT4726294.1 hypothetical protein [Planctomycetaceae bacterium]MBT5123562.1 hypothetical protein [Planctomycetaceae bacterium]MBT5597737.1 hypothetical protein [Planctomycetaceae bacterium]MBT5883236.1 hypothetical protein [Planctomycetaceae bacterium]
MNIKRLFPFIVFTGLLLVGINGFVSLIAQPKATATVAAVRYQGNSRCYRCHEKPSDFDINTGVTNFLELTEAKDWTSKDKHGSALINVTETPIGKQMLTRLKIKASEIEHQAQCTSCHSNQHWVEKHDDYAGLPDNIIGRESGVTCESCHGPSTQWDLKHSDSQWRLVDPAIKAQHGMTDLRDPVVRAETCFSCHIGNAEQGKVVTHEMYAAGHPPLPSVELDAFIDQMPAHWNSTNTKQDFTHRERYLELNRYVQDSGKIDQIVLNALVAYRTSLQLIVSISDKANEYAWPELGVYDCYGCHHELKSPSWRAQTLPGVVPGRPQFHLWPTTLIALDDASNTQLQTAGSQLRDNLNKQPFGNAKSISNDIAPLIAALTTAIDNKLAARAMALANNIDSKPPMSSSKTDAKLAITALCRLTTTQPDSFESARQIAWAIQSVYRSSQLPDNTAVTSALEQLSKQLMLEFPAGPALPTSTNQKSSQIAVSQYDPAKFQKIIADINSALNP